MGESTWTDMTVTATSPLRVRSDGDTTPLPADSLIDPLVLAVGDRVRCEVSANRIIIHGRAGGVLFRSGRSKTINGGFVINQRGYVSGQHLLPGQYGHDMWKAPHWNMCGNGGFEANIGGWTAGGGTTVSQSAVVAKSGTKSLAMASTATADSFGKFTITTVPGRLYTASAWIYLTNATGNTLGRGLYIRDPSATAGMIDTNAPYDRTKLNQWQRVTTTAVAVSTGLEVRIYADPSATVYADEVMLTEGEIAWPFIPNSPQPVFNMFANPSFEPNSRGSDSVGWAQANCLTYIDTSWFASGTRSLRIDANGTADSWIYYEGEGGLRYGVTSGQIYTVAGAIRLTAALTGSVAPGNRARGITVLYKTGSGAYTELNSPQAPNVAGSTRLSLTFTPPVGTTDVLIRFYNGHSAGSVWWDSMQLEVGGTANTYTENSYTFTQQPQGQFITLFPGSYLPMIHERANIPAGTYIASHAGTAPHRVYNAGSTPPAFVTGPIVVTLDGTDHVVHEFYGDPATTRTVGEAQLELGTVASPFARRLIGEELVLAQRYCRRFTGGYGFIPGTQASTTASRAALFLSPPLREGGFPVLAWANLWWTDFVAFNANVSAVAIYRTGTQPQSTQTFDFNITNAAAGTQYRDGFLGGQDGNPLSFFELDRALR